MIKHLIFILLFSLILFGVYMVYAYYSEKKKLRNIKKPDENNTMLCSYCAVGREYYKLDPHSESCPHMSSCQNGKCDYYKSMK